jgi:transaldolase
MNKIEIYYDGVEINKFYENPHIKGFTTNISFLKTACISDYHEFITNSLKYNKGRPISFQLYDDTDNDIELTAKRISSYDKDSIFVKIPIIKTNGESNANIIKKLHKEGIKINITTIYTKEQINSIHECFSMETDVIISIFAGKINDSGIDCSDIVKYAVDTFSKYNNIKILWAACRTIYNIFEAEKQGAHIVTVPDSVLSRLHRIGDDLYEASLKQVKQFKEDGLNSKIHFPYIIRDKCVICNNNNFIDIYKNKFPIQFTPPNLDTCVNDDDLEFLYFIGCTKCGCVQLKYLIDPNKLYSDAYNVVDNCSLMNHHNEFANFILKNILNEKILEIGGSNGFLAKILIHNYNLLNKNKLDYTIMDLCDRDPNIPNTKYINSNCENSYFPQDTTIILSHIYEHLFNPYKFTNNLKKYNVNQIIIANPDFIRLLENNDSSFLNFEHTFFCPTIYLDHIMNKNGFYKNDIQYHQQWAIFYSYIKKNDNELIYNIINNKDNILYLNKIKNYLIERENKFKNIEINNDYKTMICPAGHYGQLAYYYLNENVKKKICGFIDSDKFKIGKRVYGCDHYTFEKSELTKYKNINVILCSERYRNEITEEIKLLNKNTNIINV